MDQYPQSGTINILGNIGSGKSTMLQIINEILTRNNIPVIVLLEQLSDYHLQLSLSDPDMAAHFQTGMLTLAGARNIIASYLNASKVVIIERSIEENPIFALTKQQDGFISSRYIDTFYIKWMEFLKSIALVNSTKDKTIMLWCSLDTLMSRINTRHREAEMDMTIAYMQKLQENYFIWLLLNYNNGDVLVVDWDANLTSTDNKMLEVGNVLKKINNLSFDETITVEANVGKFLDMSFQEKENEMQRVLKALFVRARLVLKGFTSPQSQINQLLKK